jgi:hypothetical protein
MIWNYLKGAFEFVGYVPDNTIGYLTRPCMSDVLSLMGNTSYKT